MPEKVQEILKKIKEWWKKFNSRQKMLLISITAVILLALGILAFVMSRPDMKLLVTCADYSEAATVQSLLTAEGYVFDVSDDGLTFKVQKKDLAEASILIGSNDIQTSGFTFEDALDRSFSTTETDMTRKYQVYLETRFAEVLSGMDNVESAEVTLNMPEDDGTLISSNQETYAAVKLTLDGPMSEDQAAAIARFVATQLGNNSTDSVTIMDSNANLLFSGGEDSTVAGTASSQLSYQSKRENAMKSAVTEVISGTGLYDNVSVAVNLSLDFNQVTSTETNYSAQEGREEGLISEESRYSEENSSGGGGVPGTDSNDGDDTTYVIEDDNSAESTITDETITHALDRKDTTTIESVGDIKADESSIAVVVTRNVYYDEDTLTASGALDDMTWDEYVAANNDRVQTTVDDSMLQMVADATGIPTSNISIVAYDIPMFTESVGSNRNWQNYLQIILAVLILVLLGYVVFRSTRKEESEEVEPELSVESLLETTKVAEKEELEDIGYQEKSETRVQIEKFVDENPEAVAALLRNWLNEEWN
ncbi:MAG: flagellar basal-body MS-ring/collar protein FliF [Roseburia sp.]